MPHFVDAHVRLGGLRGVISGRIELCDQSRKVLSDALRTHSYLHQKAMFVYAVRQRQDA